MEKPKTTVEKLNTSLGLLSTLLVIVLNVLKLAEKVPTIWLIGGHDLGWWGLIALLLAIGAWQLRLGLAAKSRLLLPERFILQARDRRHLKGREEEVRELTDLCERQALVFLEGEAGSGKSALVQAGLVDECGRRERVHPVCVDLSGAAWEEGLTALLAGKVWHSLANGDRQVLELNSPIPADQVFASIAAAGTRLGRSLLLIFDQWDDYQNAHRQHFREGPQGNTWIARETLVRSNSFWNQIARLVREDSIHCLFVTRADNAAGLDPVRFVEARTYRLARVHANLMAPLLEEISLPESDGRPVVAHPERGWESLRERLLADLAEDDCVLPIQLSVVLQALRRLPALTVREYERWGCAEGLERLHLERNLAEAAHASGLSLEMLRKALVTLVEPARRKTVASGTRELLTAIQVDGAGADPAGLPALRNALEFLEKRRILRRRPAEAEGEELWLLHHDFLCRGVLAMERFANRWRVLLEEQASQFREAVGVTRRWKALLAPWQQLRLGWARLTGKFRYAGERRFAVFSTLRFLPLVLLLTALAAGWTGYRDYEDGHLAERFFVAIKDDAQISKLAASSERIQWKVLRLAFAGEEGAQRTKDRITILLRICLGLDPTGALRQRFWREIARPALERDPGPNVLLLALSAWYAAPGEASDTQLLARLVIRTITAEPRSEWSQEHVWYFTKLAPHLDPALEHSLADDLIKKAIMRNTNDYTGELLAQALVPLAPQLTVEQAGMLAECLSAALASKDKYKNAVSSVYGKVLSNILKPLLASGQQLDPRFTPVLVDGLVNLVEANVPAYWAYMDSRQTLTFFSDLLMKLDAEQRELVADGLWNAMLQEDRPFVLAKLARGLTLIPDQSGRERQQWAISRLFTAMEQETEVDDLICFASALGEYASKLTPEQAQRALGKFLPALEQEKDFRMLGLLARALGDLAMWLDADQAERASTRIMAAVAAQENPFVMRDLLIGMSCLAPRLPAQKAAARFEELTAELMKTTGNRWSPSKAMEMPWCLRDLACLLQPEQVNAAGRHLLEAMLQEQDLRRLSLWCTMVEAMANSLEPGPLKAISDRMVTAMEHDNTGDSLGILASRMAGLKGWFEQPYLDRAAVKLMQALGSEPERSSDRRESWAKSLASLVSLLGPETARKAADAAVSFGLQAVGRVGRDRILSVIENLEPLEGDSLQATARTLAERFARALQMAVSEGRVYGVYEPEKVRNVNSLLRHAPDQLLLDILKQPFAVDDLQRVMLQTWEVKYGEQFHNDLWRFVQWATGDPRTGRLDFRSPPQFPAHQSEAAAIPASGEGG